MIYSENSIYFNSLAQFRLLKCGKRINAENHSFGPVKRSCFWLVYVKSGSGALQMEDEIYKISDKSIICTFPDVKFSYSFDGSCDIYWICFLPAADENLENFGIRKDMPILNVEKILEIESVFESLYILSKSDRLKDQYSILSIFYNFFSLLTDGDKTIKILKKNYIDYAIRYMEDHYPDDLYIDDISSHIGIESTYFSKIFKAEVGISPAEYLSKLRMERAQILLSASDMSVAEIAVSVGIPDQFYFSRKFKAYTGFSPREYKSKI